VLENGIFVRSPEFVALLARHHDPVSGSILSAMKRECRTFCRLRVRRSAVVQLLMSAFAP
jgi:hypothetical protein